MTYIHRQMQPLIITGLETLPAVFLNGPRQAGKSTLAKNLAENYLNASYVTFDDLNTQAAASYDPENFLRDFTGPVVIDEVQIVPEIFRVLKKLIDEYRQTEKNNLTGRFLLTGSANIMALPNLADALVGRMAVLPLYQLSAAEIYDTKKSVISKWFSDEFSLLHTTYPEIQLHELIYQATYPEIASHKNMNTTLWFDSYLTTLLQRDVRQLSEIEKIPLLPQVLKILATRAGSLLNDADCARDAGLNTMTYRRYRTLLQQLFLFTLVPPWYRNIGKRLVKSPKLFFTDTAMLCYLLGVDIADLRKKNANLFGHLLENFVATELLKQLSILQDGTLYHFRTQDQKEVDFVIEKRNGNIIGLEVKASSKVDIKDFAGLKLLKEQVGDDFVRGIILYLGDKSFSIADNLIALPLGALFSHIR